MHALDDNELLSAYATQHSEEAFATLVERHVSLVYSSALRQARDPHLADEITQAVFIILARKAGSLGKGIVLAGWLCRTAHFTACNALKTERRRQYREHEAHMNSLLNEPEADAWPQMAPLLDEAVAQLNEADRNAVVLRFYEQRTLEDVGKILGLNADAAQKRVSRALEKLRKFFAGRGVASTSATIAEAISINSVQAAPVALAKIVTAAGLAKGLTAGGSTLTLVKGALKLMAWTNAKTAAVAAVAVLLVAGTTTVAVKKFAAPSFEVYFAQMDSGKLWNVPPMVIVRPSRFAGQGSRIISVGNIGTHTRVMREDSQLVWILGDAYGVGPERMILPSGLPTNHYDLMLTIPIHPTEALRDELKKGFGLVGHTETQDTDVLILRKANNGAVATMKVSAGRGHIISCDPGKLALVNYTMNDFAGVLGGECFGRPVIDETGMTGSYDISMQWQGNFDFHWTGNSDWNDERQMIAQSLREQLGLEVVPARRAVEMLVVERVAPAASTEIVRRDPVPLPVAQNAWADAGHDSPSAAFQTYLWAMKAGDLKTLLACFTPDYQKRFMQTEGIDKSRRPKTEQEIVSGSRHKAGEVAAFEVVGNQVISDDEEVLYVRAPKRGIGQVKMKKINGEWKADDEPH